MQVIKFKEHSRIDLYPLKDDINLKLYNDFKINLVTTSNFYGLILAAIQTGI